MYQFYPNTQSNPGAFDGSGDPEYISDVEVIPVPPKHTIWETLFGIPSAGSATLEQLQLEAAVDHYRAAMTHTAIQHAAAFSAMESQIAEVSPRGAARVGALADAYTAQALRIINGR